MPVSVLKEVVTRRQTSVLTEGAPLGLITKTTAHSYLHISTFYVNAVNSSVVKKEEYRSVRLLRPDITVLVKHQATCCPPVNTTSDLALDPLTLMR